MPPSLEIGAFVLGACLLVLAIAGGGFKLLGAEFPKTIDSIPLRIFSGALGLAFIGLAFFTRVGMRTNPPSTTNTAQPKSTTSRNQRQPGSAGCTLNIQHHFITMKSKPDISSEDIIRVKEGLYPVLDIKKTQFAQQQQTWFQIEDQGREGWVFYIAEAMEKSTACR